MSGVEALARVLAVADGSSAAGGPIPLPSHAGQAENILADPGPLLAALAEAGIIHPQLCSRSGAACFNGWSGDE